MAGWVCGEYRPVAPDVKYNCGSCKHWNGQRCNLERMLLRSWDK